MNKEEFKFLLKRKEGLKLEFKENFDSKNLSKEITAFANSEGGRIFIGVNDKGEVKGIGVTNKLKSEIQDIARNCDPSIHVELDQIDNVLIVNVEVKKGTDLSNEDILLMNKVRIKEFGKKEAKNFKKEYPLATNYFFVKEKKEVVAFGLLRLIRIRYLGKVYSPFGICSIISIKKGKGYGRMLLKSMINYLKKRKKTGLGFCSPKVSKFYEKSGLKIEKRFIRRFRYKNPITEKIEKDKIGDGLYTNGKEQLYQKGSFNRFNSLY